MKVLVVPQVLHGGEIHAIDINKQDKVLTCGKDNKISVWSDLLQFDFTTNDKSVDMVEKIQALKPKKTLDYHSCCVTILRWNPVENLFASGDIEGNLYLYNEDETPSATLIFNQKQKSGIILEDSKPTQEDVSKIEENDDMDVDQENGQENEHQNESNDLAKKNKSSSPLKSEEQTEYGIVDLSWSSDGRLLAWSTQDRKLHLFDTKKRTYQELSSSVKNQMSTVQRSISFDPTGHYLLSLGDDSLVQLYQYQFGANDNYKFRQIHKLSKLVNNMAFNHNYKRISWSPDGEFICIPTANKNLTSLVSIISRSKKWTNVISLVGHDLNCEVAKFNPRLFDDNLENGRSGEGAKKPYFILATAGSDNRLAIWNTTNDSPITLLNDLLTKPIADLAWNSSGDVLLLASLDGHITILRFENEELGKLAAPELVAELNEKGYKLIKPIDHREGAEANTKKGAQVPLEYVDQADAKNIDEIVEEVEEQEKKVDIVEDVHESPKIETQDWIEPEVIPAPKLEVPTHDSTNEDILNSAMSRAKLNNTVATQATTSSNTTNKTIKKEALPVNITSQKVSTKNGKKRIQPLLISNNGGKSNIATNGTSTMTTSKSSISINTNSPMEYEKPSFSVSEEHFKKSKRGTPQDGGAPTKKIKRQLEPVKFLESTLVNPNTTFARVRLSFPKVRLNFQLESKVGKETFVLDIKNGSGNEVKPSRITFYKKDKEIWTDFVPRFIQLATEGDEFWALSTIEGQVLIYSRTSGRRILPPLVIGSPLSFLESHGKFLMAVTSIGELFVWNIAERKIHLQSPASLSSILELSNKFKEDGLSKSDNVTLCSITSSGVPLLTLSNGTGYLFNKDFGAWQTITESWWAFGSHYWDSVGEDASAKPLSSSIFGTGDQTSIVALLEQKTNEEILRKTRTGRGKFFNKISKNMIMKEGFENLENTISLCHLENRILCCELLGESVDFKKFFIAYAKRCSELSLKVKLFELCSQLFGPTNVETDDENAEDVDTNGKQQWNPKICGIDKHELLKEVILTCAKCRDVQRVLLHFAKQLGIVVDDIDI